MERPGSSAGRAAWTLAQLPRAAEDEPVLSNTSIDDPRIFRPSVGAILLKIVQGGN